MYYMYIIPYLIRTYAGRLGLTEGGCDTLIKNHLLNIPQIIIFRKGWISNIQYPISNIEYNQ